MYLLLCFYAVDFLKAIVLDFLMAGTNSIVAILQWHLLNCMKNPDTIQFKIQQEIDNVVGRDRCPKWEDRHKMPYTMAVIWEMHRWKTIHPLGVPRA